MVKKLLSMVILLAAALSFCAVSPAGQDSVVFASASYGSSKLELYAPANKQRTRDGGTGQGTSSGQRIARRGKRGCG